jgi:glycosyltransferase involved in cell wall biosynthesis
MTSQLVFLMPKVERNVFSADALLARQDLYASYFAKEIGESFQKALVLYSGTEKPIQSHQFEFIEPIWLGNAKIGILAFSRESLKQIRMLKNKRLILVAGTPFQPLLAARLISSRIKNAAIQVSIHGEIGAIKKSYIKYLFLKTQLKSVAGIRFVSAAQKRDFYSEVALSPVPDVVTPVPIDSNTLTFVSKPHISTLAFVGRVHVERNPMLWVEIAKRLPAMKKVVIGEGDLAAEMKSALQEGRFFGQLDRAELEKAWSQIGVLLSTAPHESYGLSIREALLHNVPVVVKNSAGARELAEKFPKLVKLFDNADQAVPLIQELNASQPADKEFAAFKEWFLHEQNISLQALARLWVSL